MADALEPTSPSTDSLASLLAPSVPEVPSQYMPSLPILSKSSGTVQPTSDAAIVSQPIPQTTGLDTTAIIPNLPDAQKAFVTKYNRIAPSLGKLPEDVKSGLVKIDLNRVNKGQAPLTDKETLAAILTVMQKQAITKSAESDGIVDKILDIPGSAIEDVGTIAKSIPHLPGALLKEAQSLPNAGAEYQAALEETGNPISALANTPGIRMLPGAFVVGNVAQGEEGLKNILDHPTMAALDILPYAGKLAKGSTVGRIAAEEAGAAAGDAARAKALGMGVDAAEADRIASAASVKSASLNKPMSALLTKRLLPEGQIDPITGSRLTANKVGLGLENLSRRSAVKGLVDAFAPSGRELASVHSIGNQSLNDIRTGVVDVEGIDKTARSTFELRTERASNEFGIDSQTMVDLTKAYELDRNVIDTLPENQASFLREVDDLYKQVQDDHIANDNVMQLGGEIYDVQAGKRIQSTVNRFNKAQDKFVNGDTQTAGMALKVQNAIEAEINQLRGMATDAQTVGKRGSRMNQRFIDNATSKLLELQRTLDEAASPDFDMTWTEANKKLAAYNQARTSIGAPGQIGERAGVKATTRVGLMGNLTRDVRKLALMEKNVKALESFAPSRWHPRIMAEAESRAQDLLIQHGVDPAAASEAVLMRNFDLIPEFNQKYMAKTVREVESTWKEMRDAGHDPGWVHRVSPGREGGVIAPTTRQSLQGPTAAKVRSLNDPTSYYRDITVGLDHAATEIIRRRVDEQVLSTYGEMFGVPEQQLINKYLPLAQEEALKNPILDVKGHMQKLIQRDFGRWNPEQYGFNPVKNLGKNPDALYMPKSVLRNIDRLYNPADNAFLRTMDPVTGLFRVSVLALSPRWHLYNIVGNAMMLMAGEGPGAFRHWGEARRLIKDIKEGGAPVPDELRFGMNVGAKELAHDMQSLHSGREQSALWNKIQESKAAKGGKWLVNKSYDLNAFFDDTTKTMAYLNGEKRALGAGYTENAAKVVGLESARKVSQFWNELTPIERNVIRRVFPFYSWTSKILKFTAQYPMDHPVRAAIIANLAEAELEDQGDGLPKNWMDSIGVGGVDAQGNQTRVSLSGLNPFSDVANLLTLKGFIGGVNPVIATGLQQLGLENGGSAAFGNMTYDKDTGKLVPRRPGIAESLIGNVIPQIGAVNRTLGNDPEYNALLRNNPDAANRLLVSGLGIPTSIRKVNVPEARIKAELARMEAQKQAWNKALSTGDYSEAAKYPALRDNLDLLKKLRDSGALTQYNPQTGGQGGLPGLVDALAASTPKAPWPT